jgi:hypothetical protein
MISPGDFEQGLEFDTSKARSELSYEEKGDYYDSLYEAIEWYRSNPSAEYRGKKFNYSEEDALDGLDGAAERCN